MSFDKFDIPHLSANNLNTFVNSPQAWVVSYLLKIKSETTDKMSRGNEVEALIHHYVQTGEILPNPHCIDAELLEELAAALPSKDYWYQHKIELNHLGTNVLPIPIIGYLDFYYPELGLIVDYKTTQMAPWQLSRGHKVQGALYCLATAANVRFDYIVYPKPLKKDPVTRRPSFAKSVLMDTYDIAEGRAVIREGYNGIVSLLSKCNSIEEVASKLPAPVTRKDEDKFEFGWDEITEKGAKQLWNF
jgi:hypothetical protein